MEDMTQKRTPRQVFSGGPLDGTSRERTTRGKPAVYLDAAGTPVPLPAGDRILAEAGVRPHPGLRTSNTNTRPRLAGCYHAARHEYDRETGARVTFYEWVDRV